MSGGLPPPASTKTSTPEVTIPQSSSNPPNEDSSMQSEPGPPAVRLRMTVTSGFYVRSLSHDIGAAVGSLAVMSALVRTRQGEFKLGRNVLEYEDLMKGEGVWGPQVETMLHQWNERKVDRDRNTSSDDG